MRFHLIKIGPESKDSNFTEEDYIMTHNEITNKLGNFVNRTLKYKGLSEIPRGIMDINVEKYINEKYIEISNYIENIEFRKATLSIIELLDYLNKYYDDKKPWILYKENMTEFNNTIYTCSVSIANLSNLIEPFMPKTAEKIKNYLSIKNKSWKYIDKLDCIKLSNIEPLFERK